jgi:hypothetical protein
MMMWIGGSAIDPELLAEITHQLRTATERTGKRAADTDMIFPGSILTETGIERYHLENLDRLQLQLRSNPIDGFRRNKTEPVLDNMELRKNGGTLAFRIVRNATIGLGFKLGAGCKRRKVLRTRRVRRNDEIL